jgi:glycerol uptake facilitator-like aquaporin
MNRNYLAYLSEYFGAFFFILIIFLSGGNPLVVGAGLALVIFIIGGISGGHVNPAVSLSMYMNGSLKPFDLFTYVFVQLLGGVSAYYTYQSKLLNPVVKL